LGVVPVGRVLGRGEDERDEHRVGELGELLLVIDGEGGVAGEEQGVHEADQDLGDVLRVGGERRAVCLGSLCLGGQVGAGEREDGVRPGWSVAVAP